MSVSTVEPIVCLLTGFFMIGLVFWGFSNNPVHKNIGKIVAIVCAILVILLALYPTHGVALGMLGPVAVSYISAKSDNGRIRIAGSDLESGGCQYYLTINGDDFCKVPSEKPLSVQGLAAYFATHATTINSELKNHFFDKRIVARILSQLRSSIGELYQPSNPFVEK